MIVSRYSDSRIGVQLLGQYSISVSFLVKMTPSFFFVFFYGYYACVTQYVVLPKTLKDIKILQNVFIERKKDNMNVNHVLHFLGKYFREMPDISGETCETLDN